MKKEEKDNLLALSIEGKIEYSKNILKEAIKRFGPENLAVAWTGGKDSTTLVWLLKNVCSQLSIPMPNCMFIDEGDVFGEISDIVQRLKKEWNLNVTMVKNTDIASKAKELGDTIYINNLNQRNKQELININFTEDSFPFEPESYVGNHLMKTVPMKMFIEENGIKALATAIRWDEQDARKEETYFSERSNPSHTRVHPILHFRERDIWETIHKYKIPYCKLYEFGYRSLGARCSTHKNSDIPAWQQDMENTPERVGRGQDKEKIMSQLRTLGYM